MQFLKKLLLAITILIIGNTYLIAQVWNGTTNPQWTNSNVGIGFASSPTLSDKLVVNGNIRIMNAGKIVYVPNANSDGGPNYLSITGENYSGSNYSDVVYAGAIELTAGSAQNVTGQNGIGGRLNLTGGSGNSQGKGGDILLNGGSGYIFGDITLQAFSNGNVGIGTSYPSSKFHVAGNSILGGNVAVGDQIVPVYLLHVQKNTTPSIGLTSTTGNGLVMQVQTTTTNIVPFSSQGAKVIQTLASAGVNDLVLAAGGANVIKLGTNGVQRVTINATGGMGIGGANAGSALSVYRTGSSNLANINLFSGSNRLELGIAEANAGFSTSFATIGDKVIRTIGGTNGANDLIFSAEGAGNAIRIGTNNLEKLTVISSGFVGINKPIPTEQLHVVGNIKVEGKIAAVEICANATSAWCDYVFEPDYKLPKLASVQAFLTQHKHLPDVPSAAEVAANGYNMNKMDTALLKKLEEAYLYILDLEARMKVLEKKR